MHFTTKDSRTFEGFQIGLGDTIQEVVRQGDKTHPWIDKLIADGLLRLEGNEIVDSYVTFHDDSGTRHAAMTGDYIFRINYDGYGRDSFDLIIVDSRFVEKVFTIT